MMKEKPRQAYRLFIRVIDRATIRVDEKGNKFAKTKWVEVAEVNLGSIKLPNKDILEFKFQPIVYAKDEDEDNDKRRGNAFQGFFRI